MQSQALQSQTAQAQHEGTSMSAATTDMLLLTPLERVTSPLAWLDEYRLTYSPSPPSSLALSLYRKTRGRTAQALAGVKVSKGVVWSWCSQGWRTAEINFQREPLLFWWAWNQRTLGSKARYCMKGAWKLGKRLCIRVILLYEVEDIKCSIYDHIYS